MRPYVYVGIGVIAAAALLVVGCGGQDRWVTIDKPILEVREMPEHGLLYLDLGPVADCAVHQISAGNTLSDTAVRPSPRSFQVMGLHVTFLWEEGYQFRNCIGVKYTSDVDAFGEAVIEAVKADRHNRNWLVDVCEKTGWVEYRKAYESLIFVPYFLETIGAENKVLPEEQRDEYRKALETIEAREELAEIECLRNEGRS
jgi:hypothetical protein